MPIPLILGGIAIVAGLAGAGAHINAKENREKAKKMYERSDRKQDNSIELLNDENAETTKVQENLGKLRLTIANTTIKKFLNLYKKLDELNINGISFDFVNIKLTPEEIQKMENISMTASEVLGAGFSSLATGALAGVGVYGSVMALGAASTGTAIATLSGAAATNATLAWLGGGAIAAGGGGMALGSVVLGGLVAGPAILVSGIFADNKAEEALTAARAFRDEVDVACEERENHIIQLKAIQVRCREIEKILEKICIRLNPYLIELESIVDGLLKNSELSEHKLNVIHNSFSLAKFLKDTLEVNILQEGTHELTDESKKIILDVQKQLISLES